MDNLEEENRDDVALSEYGVRKSYFTMVAPSFDARSTLTVLDLSRTNIQSLPPSISKLTLLVNLTLQECSMLMELPPEIGNLQKLMTFDLEGTEIMYLPKEMGKLENLQCLRVSFCAYADEYIVCNGIENIIPRTMMSKFRKLKELSVCVNPDAKWWAVEVIEAVLEHLPYLTCLQNLKLYLPTAKELQYFLNCHAMYSNLLDFSLKIGHSEPFTSYLKTKLVDGFEKMEKCLKYENGEGSSDDIEGIIRHAKALFVFRHWTIKKLSIFDISEINYCLLVECNEMQTVVDNDGNDAFECLKYLAIHSMKKLQSIWKGPISRNSFSCLQALALHTCPDLTIVFTEDMLYNLDNLTVVIVEDCPKVISLVSQGTTRGNYGFNFLPKLRKILLLDLPELVSLSSGVYIAPRLDTLLVFNCLKLDFLSHNELSRDVKEIKGETEWWDALKNRYEYSRAFVPLERDGNLMSQLAEDTNSLKEFHKLQGRGGASAMSSSSFVPSASKPLPLHFSLYETKKYLDWVMFIKYLKYRKLPVPLVQCNSGHMVDFLKYLNKFGDIRVHVQSCVLFGHPNPDVTCFCPLSEGWGTLEAIATRLHTAYEENRLLDMKPFPSRDIESYLKEVWKSQVKALGMPVEDESDFGWRHKNSSPKKGAVTDSIKLIEHPQEMISSGHGSKSRDKRKYIEETIGEDLLESLYDRIGWLKRRPGSKSEVTRTKASTKLQDPVPILDELVLYDVPILDDYISDTSFILYEFRKILQVEVMSREHDLSVDPGATTFPGTSTHSSSSIHQVQEDEYVKSNTMSDEVISRLRNIALRASSNGCMQRCVEIYIHERKTIMQTRFLQFNIDKWSTNKVKRFEWGVLESLIEFWIKSVKTSIEHLFASEKQLCEKIFQGHVTDIEDICFEVIIQEHQIQAFNIVYTLSVTNPPPDKIFIILDLYKTLDHFLNNMCFFAKSRDPFQATVNTQLLAVLSDKITITLSLFEMVLLYHESSVIFVGPIDPLSRYVMSYLHQLSVHKHTLRKLSLPKLPSIDKDDLSLYSEELNGQNALSRHVIWIIMMMVSNLEGKAKLCEDGSAGHFFAMKNISYIVHSIEGHRDLMEVVGDGYFGKLIQKLDYAKVKYLMLELEKIIEMRDYGVE